MWNRPENIATFKGRQDAGRDCKSNSVHIIVVNLNDDALLNEVIKHTLPSTRGNKCVAEF